MMLLATQTPPNSSVAQALQSTTPNRQLRRLIIDIDPFMQMPSYAHLVFRRGPRQMANLYTPAGIRGRHSSLGQRSVQIIGDILAESRSNRRAVMNVVKIVFINAIFRAIYGAVDDPCPIPIFGRELTLEGVETPRFIKPDH